MSITDHISMLSSLSLSGSPRHVTDAERRDHRMRAQGLTLASCPTCNERATVETLVAHRPGESPMQRVMLRCRRAIPRHATRQHRSRHRPPCRLHVLAEVPVGQPLPPLEELLPQAPVPTQDCTWCGTSAPVHDSGLCAPCRVQGRQAKVRHNNTEACVDCGERCYGERCSPCFDAWILAQVRTCRDCGGPIPDSMPLAKLCARCFMVSRGCKPPERPQDAPETITPTEPPPPPAEAATEPPGTRDEPEEETSMPETDQTTATRTCLDCGTPIQVSRNRKRCHPCQQDANRKVKLDYTRRKRLEAQEAAQEQPPAPAEQPTPEPMRPTPLALRRSVLDLASEVRALPKEAQRLLYDIASLSHDRRALLWYVVRDAEEVA